MCLVVKTRKRKQKLKRKKKKSRSNLKAAIIVVAISLAIAMVMIVAVSQERTHVVTSLKTKMANKNSVRHVLSRTTSHAQVTISLVSLVNLVTRLRSLSKTKAEITRKTKHLRPKTGSLKMLSLKKRRRYKKWLSAANAEILVAAYV